MGPSCDNDGNDPSEPSQRRLDPSADASSLFDIGYTSTDANVDTNNDDDEGNDSNGYRHYRRSDNRNG